MRVFERFIVFHPVCCATTKKKKQKRREFDENLKTKRRAIVEFLDFSGHGETPLFFIFFFFFWFKGQKGKKRQPFNGKAGC
jgi:hypothetical protein